MKARLKLIQYVGFIAVGIIANIIGPMLPSIRADLHINYSQAGMLLSGQFVGMLLTALIGGQLMDKFGPKPFLLTGGAILLAGLIGSMTAGSFVLLYTLNLLTGLGFGIYEVGINALCADNSEENKGGDMGFLHFFYGAGAISGPILAAASIKYLNSWRICFGISAILPLLVTLLLLTSKSSALRISKPVEAVKGNTNANPLKSMFVWAVGLTGLFYVGIETVTGGWIPEFWKSNAASSLIPAALVPSIFWGCLTLGRLFAGRLADRMGLMKYLLSAAGVTLVLAALWNLVSFDIGILALVSLLGFALSGQYPTLMAMVTASFPGRTGTTSAFLTAAAGVSGFILPTLVGKAADMFGIGVMPIMILIYSFFLVFFMSMMNYTLKKLKA